MADDPAAWREVGFSVDDAGCCVVGTVVLRLDPAAAAGGVAAWTVRSAATNGGDVDGLPTAVTDGSDVDVDVDGGGSGAGPTHPNGAVAIDHLVVDTPDLPRTIAAIEALGLDLRRTRDGEAYGRPVRQAFFRMGEVVLEVVGPPDPSGEDRPARFFGLAFTVTDLDAAAALLGDRLGEAKEAVQPGRRIATLRSAAGLRVPVALMSGEPR